MTTTTKLDIEEQITYTLEEAFEGAELWYKSSTQEVYDYLVAKDLIDAEFNEVESYLELEWYDVLDRLGYDEDF